MKLNQNQLESLQNRVKLGKITADQANVEKVKMVRVLIVSHLPSAVRKVLNKAVKSGELGHIKKDGRKPEVYFHPTFEYLVNGERNKYERKMIEAMKRICI